MRYILKKISKLSQKIWGTGNCLPFADRITDPNIASEIVYNALMGKSPCMIARYGATELMAMVNYLGVKRGRPNLLSYMLGRELDWWWRDTTLNQLKNWSGFFPPTIDNVEKFCELMITDSKQLDVLVSWLNDEFYFKNSISAKYKIQGLFIDPFWAKQPWTKALENKTVLVVHPFAQLIKKQYENKRQYLFSNADILPMFKLHVIPAIQSLGGAKNGFDSWFDALEYMKQEISKIDFDICLLGCGAYGFPLAAYVKSLGKKAVHIGGSLQLLFGIKGARWENPAYGFSELGKEGCYLSLMNENWVRPNKEGRAINAESVESGCYW